MTGFLCLYKNSGKTSFQAVAGVKRVTGEKKLGHTGTLDQMAEGVLPVALGRASKFIELLPDTDKAYTASLRLGLRTDTLDITGAVVETREIACTEQDVRAVLSRFTGDLLQVPPMYSAKSVGGVRLYKLARAGEEIERKAVPIHIESIDFLGGVGENEYSIAVRCGKGTYIRSLIDDIGEALGCGAVMTKLTRTYSNGFDIKDAHTLTELEECGDIPSLLIPVDRALEVYPALRISAKQTRLFKNGVSLALDRLDGVGEDRLYRIYSPEGGFLGVGERADEIMKMRKLYDIS